VRGSQQAAAFVLPAAQGQIVAAIQSLKIVVVHHSFSFVGSYKEYMNT
jgi:hypothetical protein